MNPHMARSKLFLLAGFTTILVLAFISASLTSNESASQATGAGASATASPTPYYNNYPPGKREAAQREEQMISAMETSAALRPPVIRDPRTEPNTPDPREPTPIRDLALRLTPHPTRIANRPLGAGILVESGMAPFSPLIYLVRNHWYEVVNGKTIVVYAGLLTDEPGVSSRGSQGIVIVDNGGQWARFPTPTKAGAVRIVDAKGERLVLLSDSGVTFYFDVPVQRFVSSLTDAAPTATPKP